MTTGIFSAFLLGLGAALLSLGNEMRYGKALRLFSSNSAAGFAIPMVGAVLFSLVFEVFGKSLRVPFFVERSMWWLTLALGVSLARGAVLGNFRGALVGLMGLAPGLLFAGLLMDRFFVPRDVWLIGSLVFGGVAGFSLAFSMELLKGAWLEFPAENFLCRQYILETEEFFVGSGDYCDMTLGDGPEHRFMILDRDGMHSLETLSGDPVLVRGRGKFRYRILSEGDTIQIDDRVWVYHSRILRTRDVVGEAAA